MEIDTLKDLYVDELKDLYSAEKQLVKALPKMAKAAKDKELQQAFRNHLKETEQHVARIEQICQALGVSPRGKKCVGMEGLIEEGNEMINEANPEALDAGLISKAQHVEHYEMAGYGTVRTYALHRRSRHQRRSRSLITSRFGPRCKKPLPHARQGFFIRRPATVRAI